MCASGLLLLLHLLLLALAHGNPPLLGSLFLLRYGDMQHAVLQVGIDVLGVGGFREPASQLTRVEQALTMPSPSCSFHTAPNNTLLPLLVAAKI